MEIVTKDVLRTAQLILNGFVKMTKTWCQYVVQDAGMVFLMIHQRSVMITTKLMVMVAVTNV